MDSGKDLGLGFRFG